MRSRLITAIGTALLGAIGICSQAAHASEETTEAVLQRFVDSYRSDPMALTATFGIQIGDDWWHVRSVRSQKPYAAGKQKQYTLHEFGPHQVSLHAGPPQQPTWFFHFADRETLDRVDQGLWTATTAAAKSTPDDKTALELEEMSGFAPSQQSTAITYQVMEHFFKHDPAEVTRFSRDSSLPSHGAALVALYTMKDKRIAWFSLGQDEAANDDRGLDKSQVPNLFIITGGRGKAEIGEQTIDLEPGMSVFVGPYVKHIFRNPNPEPLEGILVLFGDNIDYVHGQSYLDFVEAEYAFYGSNEAAHKPATEQATSP
ncbi:MAG: cupin domain-containing protein [Xanthomonadales bacterium]|nr:cupin domain-containing protein [Xanthomonadales bacterium]